MLNPCLFSLCIYRKYPSTVLCGNFGHCVKEYALFPRSSAERDLYQGVALIRSLRAFIFISAGNSTYP